MKKHYPFLLLLLLAYCTVFANNGLFDIDVMEARNIVTAREMVTEHNWLIPTMNGETRIAKPPLPTWLTALPILFGKSDDNLRAMRTAAGIAAIVMMIFTYLFVTKLTDDRVVAFICAAVMISSEFLFNMSKRASWDIFCHTFMLGAIWMLISGWHKKGSSFHLFFFAGLLMGLSFMSKGPVSFHSMLLPFLLSYIYIFGYRTILTQWKGTLLSVFICFVIGAAWPCYLYLYIPDALVNVEAAEMHTWFEIVSKPLWYYMSFPVHAGLWICLFVATILYPVFPNKYHPFNSSKTYKFLLFWIIWIVVLLTIVPKKSTHYLFPVIVPTSILIGMYIKYLIDIFRERRESFSDRVVIAVHAIIIFIIAIFSCAFYLYVIIKIDHIFSIDKFSIAMIFCFLGLLSLFFFRKLKITSLMTVTAILICFLCITMPPVIAQRIHHRSFMVLTKSRGETVGRKLFFYSSYQMNIKEIWAIGGRVKKIDPVELTSLAKPLAFFSKERPEKAIEKLSVSDRWTITSYEDKHSHDVWYLSLVW
jgi:4-amino-4-deoxy-L-arabinose transferase-like glycosyltransferase